VIDNLERVWTQVLGAIDKIVSPDWGTVINALPLLVIVGVVGPLLTLLAVFWLYYAVLRPRARIRVEEGPRVAALGADGAPVFPVGLPYCLTHRLIFTSGTTSCDLDHFELAVICPMCGVGRRAGVDTCGNCGLVFRVEQRMRIATAAVPPPGGAAIA